MFLARLSSNIVCKIGLKNFHRRDSGKQKNESDIPQPIMKKQNVFFSKLLKNYLCLKWIIVRISKKTFLYRIVFYLFEYDSCVVKNNSKISRDHTWTFFGIRQEFPH